MLRKKFFAAGRAGFVRKIFSNEAGFTPPESRHFYKNDGNTSNKIYKKHFLSLTGFTLTELAFVVLIIVIFIVLLTPVISKIRKRRTFVVCEENLQKIGMGLNLYASEHEEKFPMNLNELLKGGYVEDEKVFDCPSNAHIGNAKEPDYHYETGHTILSPSDTAIVFDRVENHKNGKHVLYISGDIVWVR